MLFMSNWGFIRLRKQLGSSSVLNNQKYIKYIATFRYASHRIVHNFVKMTFDLRGHKLQEKITHGRQQFLKMTIDLRGH